MLQRRITLYADRHKRIPNTNANNSQGFLHDPTMQDATEKWRHFEELRNAPKYGYKYNRGRGRDELS